MAHDPDWLVPDDVLLSLPDGPRAAPPQPTVPPQPAVTAAHVATAPHVAATAGWDDVCLPDDVLLSLPDPVSGAASAYQPVPAAEESSQRASDSQATVIDE